MQNPLEEIRSFDKALEERARALMIEFNGDKRKVISKIYAEFGEVIGTEALDEI